MLTKRGIKKFCTQSIGVFVTNPKEDIIVQKTQGIYVLKLEHLRAPSYIVKREWNHFAEGTKYEQVYLDLFGC